MRGIETLKASGDEVVVTLKEASADFPYLMADYHLPVQPNGGKDDPNAGIGAMIPAYGMRPMPFVISTVVARREK